MPTADSMRRLEDIRNRLSRTRDSLTKSIWFCYGAVAGLIAGALLK